MSEHVTYKLSCDPLALEKCFLVADVLADRYHEPGLEYGVVGLADRSRPFHVLATAVLPGQEVTCASVYQSGFDVFRLREEVAILSKRLSTSLVPVAFCHRHPGACGMSGTDERFLREVFVSQVSTVVTLSETCDIDLQRHDCACAATARHKAGDGSRARRQRVAVQYGVAFSLIVNREREYSLDAARMEWCPFCGRARTHLVPATLELHPKRSLTDQERAKLRCAVEIEVEAKIKLSAGNTSVSGALA